MELSIRKATTSDCMKVFELSNDPVVRKNSINQEKIELENHLAWYNSKIDDSNCEYYVVESKLKDFIAQVRFDNTENGVYVGISVVEEFRGRSLGSDIIKLATEKTSFNEIKARVRRENIASYRSFLKAGYEELNTMDDDYYTLNYNRIKRQ